MKDRVGRQRNLMPTSCALPASLLCQFVGMSVPAARTHEAVRPATSGQILPAGFFARKICLKFAQSLRKRRPRHPTTLQLVACLNNRISRSCLAVLPCHPSFARAVAPSEPSAPSQRSSRARRPTGWPSFPPDVDCARRPLPGLPPASADPSTAARLDESIRPLPSATSPPSRPWVAASAPPDFHPPPSLQTVLRPVAIQSDTVSS